MNHQSVSENLANVISPKCEEVGKWLKSMGHPIRIKILCALLAGDKNVNQLTALCHTSQSAMSQYLARMKAESLVDSRREGHNIVYFVASDRTIRLLQAIKEILC